MKKILIIVFMASVSMAEEIETHTSIRTNKISQVREKIVYTRGGITNLVRDTTTRDGKIILRRQRVFHDHRMALEIVEMENGTIFETGTNLPFKVGTRLKAEGKLDCVNLMDHDAVTLDHFVVTNGLLQPIPTADIKKANSVAKDMQNLFEPENVRENTKEEFIDQVQELINKHSTKDSTN